MSSHTLLDPARDRVAPNLCALGIMTKAPQPGQVKTRLSPPLSTQQASELNKCFLKDIGASIEAAARLSSAIGVAVYTPVGKEALFDGLLPTSFSFVPQRGDNFGERLIFAGEDLLKLGFASFCLINSDSPTVPSATFVAVAEMLAQSGDRVVLGPSDDGGYYLIGLKQMHRRLFEGVDWSTERVFEQTRQRAAALNLETAMLPSAFDIDESVSLKRLWNEIADDPATPAQQTRAYLRTIFENAGEQ